MRKVMGRVVHGHKGLYRGGTCTRIEMPAPVPPLSCPLCPSSTYPVTQWAVQEGRSVTVRVSVGVVIVWQPAVGDALCAVEECCAAETAR